MTPKSARSGAFTQPISGLMRNSHAIAWMIPGTMSGMSAKPYQSERPGTFVRSMTHAIAVPATNAKSAEPAEKRSEFARSSTLFVSATTRSRLRSVSSPPKS